MFPPLAKAGCPDGYKEVDLNPLWPGTSCVFNPLWPGWVPDPNKAELFITDPIGTFADTIYDGLPYWPDSWCPSGYDCGYEALARSLNIDPKAAFRIAGKAAIAYYFPQSLAVEANGAVLKNYLFKKQGNSRYIINQIMQACNVTYNDKNANMLADAIVRNKYAFAKLINEGGIRKACDNSRKWGIILE